MALTPEQLEDITRPPLLAILSTVNPDGSPQATPVWYEFDGEAFLVTSFANRVKVRNLRHSPRASLVIVDTVTYGEPLIVSGTAEVIDEGAQEATLRCAIRYQGEEHGRVSAARMGGQPRVIIRITPERVLYEGERITLGGMTATCEDITG